MQSLKKLYRVGNGPSSSHTIGPKIASQTFLDKNPTASKFSVTLYGSLALTGRGHLTDVAILSVLEPIAPTKIIWQTDIVLPFHPNGMKFEAFDSEGKQIDQWLIYSIGGGSLANEDIVPEPIEMVYDMSMMSDILDYCVKNGKAFWEYVQEREDSDILQYLEYVWEVMINSVEDGLEAAGVLPGGLGVKRKASEYYIKAQSYTEVICQRGRLNSYALAVSETNASGGLIATAPTCGSSGVVPAIVYHIIKTREFNKTSAIRALATAGLFGNIVKHNASVSGAEVGCQGEIGVACSMAAAAACQLFGGSPYQIEYAAEMGLEHHLGLTCDPVGGLVQIPCIERNAFAATRAMDSNIYALFSDGHHAVSFDQVVDVMKKTGHDLPSLYKETSLGGLALEFDNKLVR